MDGKKKYAAFSIPQRDGPPAKGVLAHVQIGPLEVVFSTDAPFAEVEYEPQVCSVSAPAQPIRARASDPVRERFYSMRALASGIPFARNDARLFYKQARFMEDFTDDYPGKAPFFMYYPSYQHMGYDQLRTYFTWRAEARRGVFTPISLSYVFLYIYELLSGIGVQSPADGLDRLMAVWMAYKAQHKALYGYLPGWIKDYHIYYPLPHSFADFVCKHGLQKDYPDPLLLDADAESCFARWNSLSSYDVTKSKFYSEGHDALMRDCFAAVHGGITDLCTRHGFRIEDLLISHIRKGVAWHPFARALFAPSLAQPDRQVEMSGRETYTCKSNRWTADIPVCYADRRELVGYLMKKTEVCLRQAMRYRYKLTANPRSFCNMAGKLGRLHITLAELDAVIEKAVADFHRGLTRTVVVVDGDNLNRIRREALRTQDKLIVPEGEAPPTLAVEPPGSPDVAQPPEALPAEPDGWAALGDALRPMEREALRLLLTDGAAIKAFADENGVMLEVLADCINEKAADCVGDSIIDFADSMVLYDAYKEKVVEMIG